MSDYSTNIIQRGALNLHSVVKALERDLPFRSVTNAWLQTEPTTINSNSYTAIQNLTVDVNLDDAIIVHFNLTLQLSSSGDFDFRVVYGSDEDVASCVYDIAKFNNEVVCVTGKALIENQIGAMPIVIQGKCANAPTDLLTVASSQIKAFVFKKRSQPEDFPVSGISPVLWLEGDDFFIVDSSFQASKWNDKSASAIEAAQATSGNRPLVTGRDNLENLALYSEDLSNAAWTKDQTSVSANSTTNPLNGASTADTVVEAATSGVAHYVYQSVANIMSGVRYRFSGYFKAAGRTRFSILAASSTAWGNFGLEVNLGSQSVTSGWGTIYNATITDAGDGWYRVSFEADASANGAGNIQVGLRDNSGNATYAGDGTSGLYIYGVQVQRASCIASYVATTSHAHEQGIGGHRAMSFRQADKMTLTGNPAALKISGDVSFFFVVQKRTSTGAGADESLINCLTGSATGYLIYYDNNDGQLHYLTANGSTATADSNTSLLTLDETTVIAITKIGTTATFYKNGIAWGSGTVSNPSNQTYFDICQSNRGIVIAAMMVISGTMSSTNLDLINAALLKKYHRPSGIDSGVLSSNYIKDLISSFAGKVFEEVWSGSSTLSGSANVIDSMTIQVEEDEFALIFADVNYKTSSTSTGNCDVYLTIDSTLYGEKHGLEYGYDGTAAAARKYRASLMANKNPGNGGQITVELKHDAVSGANVTVTESQILALVLKRRV